MGNKNLVRELRRKLEWFTFEASEEEFDVDEMQKILLLLDKLDPIPEIETVDVDEQLSKLKKMIEKGRLSQSEYGVG